MAYRFYLSFLLILTIYVFKTWGLCDASFSFLFFLIVSFFSQYYLFRPEDHSSTNEVSKSTQDVTVGLHKEEVTRLGEQGSVATNQSIEDLLIARKRAEVRFEKLLFELVEIKAVEERELLREQILLFINKRKDTRAQDLLELSQQFNDLLDELKTSNAESVRCKENADKISKILEQFPDDSNPKN